MDLFKPSIKILERICQGKRRLSYHKIYPRGDDRFNEEMVNQFVLNLFPIISAFYSDKNFIRKEKLEQSNQKIYNVSGESIKNCYDHGPKNEKILFGLFLGDDGVCYGFKDGGDYFKNEKIKNKYENKIEITEFDQNTLESNFQVGVNEYIFPNSDIIEIDEKKGILYCVQLKENLLREFIL